MSYSEVLAAARHAIEHDLRVAMPARVESYDAAKQVVSVQPLIRDYFEGDDGALVWERLPVISNVPVAFPTAGGIFLTLPIQAGDVGLVIITDRSLERWLSTGGEVTPEDTRTHNLSDGVFYPGLRPAAQPRTGVSTTAAALQVQGGVGVFVKSGKVGLGEENPGDAVAMAAKVETEINNLWGALTSHTHPVVGGTANATSTSGSCGSVGSTTVKVKG
jgi:hypothetical protein